MRKITLLLTFFAPMFFASAEVLLTETFDYAAGTNLESVAGWSTTGTLTTGSGRILEENPLTYSNTGGEYLLSGVGKALNNNYQNGTNYIAYRSFNSVSSGIIYMSFLYKTNDDQGQSNSEIIGMSDRASNSNIKAWTGKQADQTKNPFRLGITRISTTGADIQWGTGTVSKNTIYLMVIKYDFTTQKASLYVDPEVASSEEPAIPYAFDDLIGTPRSALNCLMFKHNGSSIANFIVGGIRISTTWAEAVAKKATDLPQIAVPTVGTASNVKAESFTANWTSVAGATGYDVKVYQGAGIVGTYSVAGENTESLEVGGLWVNTAYTYTVKAKGDGTTSSDSDESAESASFTTLSGLVSITTDFSDEVWGEAVAVDPGLDSYPSSEINGYILKSAFLRTGSTVCLRGDAHQNRIAVDKNTHGSNITLPIVQSVKQIEIHAASGSDGRGFKLEKTIDGKTWDLVGTYTTDKAININTISVSSDEPVKFRIANNTTSALYVWQIITRTTDPVLLDPPVAEPASGITISSFTANWTAVENATGYTVKVYQGETLVGSNDVSGQATESLLIENLETETAYTYKVLAKGDGFVNYADSYLSAAEAFTTSSPTSERQILLNDIDIYSAGKTIYATEKGNFEVYNLQGAKLIEVKIADNIPTNLPTGLYIVKFTAENGNKTVLKTIIR